MVHSFVSELVSIHVNNINIDAGYYLIISLVCILIGESFTKNVISYGTFGIGKGTGIYFSIADLHNTGRKDIIVAGKDGLYVFFNEGL